MKLYKGSCMVARWSDYSLYSEAHVTFEGDAGAYDQKDAQGFVKLNAASEAACDTQREVRMNSLLHVARIER